jgi:hypothetical protein
LRRQLPCVRLEVADNLPLGTAKGLSRPKSFPLQAPAVKISAPAS